MGDTVKTAINLLIVIVITCTFCSLLSFISEQISRNCDEYTVYNDKENTCEPFSYICDNGSPKEKGWYNSGYSHNDIACNSCNEGYILNNSNLTCEPRQYVCSNKGIPQLSGTVNSITQYFNIGHTDEYCIKCFDDDLEENSKYFILMEGKALICRQFRKKHLNDDVDENFSYYNAPLRLIPIVSELPKKWTFKYVDNKDDGYVFGWDFGNNNQMMIKIITIGDCETAIVYVFERGEFKLIELSSANDDDQRMCDYFSPTEDDKNIKKVNRVRITDTITGEINNDDKCFTERYTSKLKFKKDGSSEEKVCRTHGSLNLVQCNTSDSDFYSFYTTPSYMFQSNGSNDDIVTFRNYEDQKYCRLVEKDADGNLNGLSTYPGGWIIDNNYGIFCDNSVDTIIADYKNNNHILYTNGDTEIYINDNGKKPLCYHHKYFDPYYYVIQPTENKNYEYCKWVTYK